MNSPQKNIVGLLCLSLMGLFLSGCTTSKYGTAVTRANTPATSLTKAEAVAKIKPLVTCVKLLRTDRGLYDMPDTYGYALTEFSTNSFTVYKPSMVVGYTKRNGIGSEVRSPEVNRRVPLSGIDHIRYNRSVIILYEMNDMYCVWFTDVPAARECVAPFLLLCPTVQ